MDAEKKYGRSHNTRLRLLVMAVAGLVVGAVVSVTAGGQYGLTAGWAVACAVYIAWAWIVVGRMDEKEAERYATREDPSRAAAEILILIASVGSLVAVVFLLGGAKHAAGAGKEIIPVLALASVALSWFLVHTLFTLRYASLYYTGTNGGIDFNEDEPPNYLDFAYVAFTLGMTYQVSDTDLQTRAIRATALRQGLLSYLFGAVVLASAINLVVGLAQ
ncbi:DUF1345 domain-containing protein [Leifsonia sp. NPDC058248]|uniref:DUF1345 domain-containing protein n=1 Tax=Leifsonia sp. NPDC058248 TaxID=3346402 RepID=UPI0036D84040